MFSRLVRAMAEPASKRLKTPGGASALIGTHSGHFHADEALAVHMLRMLPAYRDAPLVRSRDPAVLASCHTVVDVGGEYDAARNRYDHHQRGFAATFPGRPTKLSSAGLVFLHFGRAIIAQRLGDAVEEDADDVQLLHRTLYEHFVEALDAHDNGIAAYDPAALAAAGIPRRFAEGGFSLGALVARRNPRWNDPPAGADPQRAEDDRFLEASAAVGAEFARELDYYAASWLPARAVVRAAFDARAEHDPAGRLLVLDGPGVPWKDHLYGLEEEAGRGPQVLYVLYAEGPAPGAKWRVQAVPEARDSFVSRRPLPEAWRGFRDDELDGIAGVGGCVFVHAAGFIGGNKTFEGALEMAAKALAD